MSAQNIDVMKNRFVAYTEEAASLAFRAAHTTFVKQTQDFGVSLATPEGEFFGCPTMTGATSLAGQRIDGFVRYFEGDLAPGDVLITNDPYRTNGLVTHSMDIHMVRPIFHDGGLLCFAWSFFHASDIGGAVPGSISPSHDEIFQEGIVLPPMKLVRADQIDDNIRLIILANSRIGEDILGDIASMSSAMSMLDRRMTELCRIMGPDAVRAGMDGVLNYSERKARQVISNLKNGTYQHEDVVELADDRTARIHCTLTIDGDRAEIDFAGSSPQVRAALCLHGGTGSHQFLALALTYYIQTIEPSTPLNGGIMRPINAHAPAGSILNANFPAASGNRWVTVMRANDALMGCLNQATAKGVSAAGAGQTGIISASWIDPETGVRRVSVVEPFLGGSGGRSRNDGVHANDCMVGYLRNTPVEVVEAEVPLTMHEISVAPESFGHGKHRGGGAVAMRIEANIDRVTLTIRGMDRFRHRPWGIDGGLEGQCGSNRLIRDGQVIQIDGFDVLELNKGDVLLLRSPGGGGFGPPKERSRAQTERDLRDGLISPETARTVYGLNEVPGGTEI